MSAKTTNGPTPPPLPRPGVAHLSQADEALRRAIAAKPIVAPARPLSGRSATVWGH